MDENNFDNLIKSVMKSDVNFSNLHSSQKVLEKWVSAVDEVQESFDLDDQLKIRKDFIEFGDKYTYKYVNGVVGLQGQESPERGKIAKLKVTAPKISSKKK
jgi:hypothetical protein